MKNLLFIFALTFAIQGHSQDTIVNFLNRNGKVLKQEDATVIQMIVKKDTAFLESLFSVKTRKLLSIGHYSDEAITKKVGQFQFYDKEGVLEIIANYNKEGKYHGKYLSFKKGKEQISGIYSNGKKNGMWNYYDDNGNKQARIIYNNDDVYKYTLWNETGKVIDEPLIVNKNAKYKKGYKALSIAVSKKLRKRGFKTKHKGTLYVMFTINEQGKVENIITNKKLSKRNKKIIDNVFYGFTDWEPGIKFNRKVKMKFTQPIKL